MATKKYELMVILDPARSEDDQKASLDQIEEVIKKYGGTPEDRNVWGRRRLAYEINNRKDGWYALLYFTAEAAGEVLKETDLHCKYNDDILRHLITVAVIGKSKGQKPAETSGEDRPPYWTGGRSSRSHREREDRRPPAPKPATEEKSEGEQVAAPAAEASTPSTEGETKAPAEATSEQES